ncbi:alpha/beta-hydrolase [Aspergillus homomorphus CBS 101889]|uniref:Alpha/beta-hydrolase n=1 Tax=Aspergillus homomorphus (strain CBS 101889) TaxID=1450537 RepID=A0A395I234_ASPHC|nr:alpha/beta-hydrolase [Aspergillus homomorphus CBS 101889]RAL14231.1 alpha/beta-hydrolase [Aspergillus homomorphus CBS 101889]
MYHHARNLTLDLDILILLLIVLDSPPTVIETAYEIKYIGSRTDGVPVNPAKGSVTGATQPGAWCPQGMGVLLPFTSRVDNVSENCLSLRIARSSGVKRHARLPVAVWLHGGGHALGSASDILYNPDGLVRGAAAARKPLIYVGINYRLGLFGFATSKAMVNTKQTNAGLRDQRAALQWVRDHIEAFGGDSNRGIIYLMTAIGQSVGNSDIGLQLTSFNSSRGMMSGTPKINFNSDPGLVTNNTAAIARQVGCIRDNDGQSLETLECLRSVPAAILTSISVNVSRSAHRPSELVRTGKVVKGIPIVASWVTNDGAWYASPQTSTDEDVLGSFERWVCGLSESMKEKLLQLYPVEEFGHMVRQDYDDEYARNGASKASQVWLYEHNATRFAPVYEAMGVPMWRVTHLSDIPYVFNNPHLEGGADKSLGKLALSETVSKAIIEFVHGGSPAAEGIGVQKWSSASPARHEGQRSSESANRLSIQIFGGSSNSSEVTIGRDEDVERLFDRCDFTNGPQMRE